MVDSVGDVEVDVVVDVVVDVAVDVVGSDDVDEAGGTVVVHRQRSWFVADE